MKLKSSFLLLLATASLPAATLFSSFPTGYIPPSTTLTDSGSGDSVEYSIGVVGDPNLSWDIEFGGENNNESNVLGPKALITFTTTAGTGSIDLIAPTGANSFGFTTGASLGEFTLRIDYLNSSGGSLGMVGRNSGVNTYGPMIQVNDNTLTEAVEVGISMFNAGNIIQPSGTNGFLPLEPVGFPAGYPGLAPTVTGSYNSTTGELVYPFTGTVLVPETMGFPALKSQGSIHRFDDATNGDSSDDNFSSIEIRFTPDDGTFDAGQTISLSFDSRILAETTVPEPTSGLLSLMAGSLLLARRKR